VASLDDIHRQQSRYTDSMVSAFEEHLRVIVGRAQASVMASLQKRLSITDGVIDQTPGNLRILRTLNDLFVKEMDEAGYERLVNAFVGEFRGQLIFVEEVIQYLSDAMVTPLPALKWTAKDADIFGGFATNAATALETAVEATAGSVMTRAMFSIGGLKFEDLVKTLIEKFETTVARARTLADTSMTVFYRTATDRAFQQIEGDLPEKEVRYRYAGPDDAVTRPFCHRLLAIDKAYSREQIDEMSNGMLPNVWLTCGGWSCRHSWIIDVRGLLAKAA
jgi:hypothetical protein